MGNKVLAGDEVKMRSSGGSQSKMAGVLINRGNVDTEMDAHREGIVAMEADRGDASISKGSQRPPIPPGGHPEAWGRSFFTASKGSSPADTLSSDFRLQSCEPIRFCGFEPYPFVVLCDGSPGKLSQVGAGFRVSKPTSCGHLCSSQAGAVSGPRAGAEVPALPFPGWGEAWGDRRSSSLREPQIGKGGSAVDLVLNELNRTVSRVG